MLQRVQIDCFESLNKRLFFFLILEAQYIGTWINGKRQGPGEIQFGQYKYVGKFHENYVRYFEIRE